MDQSVVVHAKTRRPNGLSVAQTYCPRGLCGVIVKTLTCDSIKSSRVRLQSVLGIAISDKLFLHTCLCHQAV